MLWISLGRLRSGNSGGVADMVMKAETSLSSVKRGVKPFGFLVWFSGGVVYDTRRFVDVLTASTYPPNSL